MYVLFWSLVDVMFPIFDQWIPLAGLVMIVLLSAVFD
jgi:hypothetical protein